MPEKTLAAIKVGASTLAMRELDLPDIGAAAALLKVEVAGVCGTDVSQYRLPLRGSPIIMGHENVGYLAHVGKAFAKRKGVKEGDFVFPEHYVPCGNCAWDHMGEYRHCAATEWFDDPQAIRLGHTAMDVAPGLWGGFSHSLSLPPNAIIHQVPAGLTALEAGVVTPMANGMQWALMDGGVGPGLTVLIQGPGQQGLCQVMHCNHRRNGWGIDRDVQKRETFSGIEGVNQQDRAVQEAMGPIVDRSKENLCHTDAAVIAARQRLLEAVRTVGEGGKAPGADESYYHLRAIKRILPADARWLEVLKPEMYPAGGPI